jgi:uncharacterized protein (DUF1330 family)
MSAYLIGDISIPDPKRYEVYKRDLAAIVARHGGEYLARYGDFEVLEGDWQPTRLVLFRFPSRQAIRDFLDDPDYRPLRDLRQIIGKTRLIAVDGI